MAQLPRPAGHAPRRTFKVPVFFFLELKRDSALRQANWCLPLANPLGPRSWPTLLADIRIPPHIRGGCVPMSTLFAFLHHLAAFTLVAALAVEFVLTRQELTLASARKLPLVDAVLGGSATLLLIIGLLRVFYFEKGSAYYFSSHAFLTKLTVFIIVAVLSIVPTVEFLSWRKTVKAGQVPVVEARKMRLVSLLIHGELVGVVIILLAAAIMARGGFR